MNNFNDNCHNLGLYQLQKKQDNLSSHQPLRFHVNAEAENYSPEILSLESDVSSGPGAPDDDDQSNTCLAKTITKQPETFNDSYHCTSNPQQISDVTEYIPNGTYEMPNLFTSKYYRETNTHDLCDSFNKEQTMLASRRKQKKQIKALTNSSFNYNHEGTNSYDNHTAWRRNLKEFYNGEDMDLKYTELTHKQLKSRLRQIHEKNRSQSSSTHVEHSVPLEGKDNQYVKNSALLKNHKNDNTSYSKCTSKVDSCNQIVNSASKLETILHIKDDLLQEKEVQIIKLQFEIKSLHHQLYESEAALRQVGKSSFKQAYSSSSLPTSDSINQLQEKKIYDLEQLLGKTESELADTKVQFSAVKKEMQNKMKILKANLQIKEQSCSELKRKQKAFADHLEKYRRRVESLEHYLGDLPTIEESNKIKTEVHELGQERETLVLEIADYKNKLEEKRKALNIKDDLVESLRKDVEEKVFQLKQLQTRLDKSEKSKQDLGRNERDEFEDLRLEVSRLQEDKKNSSAMLTKCESKIENLRAKHKQEIAEYHKKLSNAEDLAENSRRDVFMKQQASKKVNSAVKSLNAQNQQLLDDNLSLQEKIRNLEEMNTNFADVARICTKLQREGEGAVQDLKGITQVLIQTAEGADPNISALLGVRSDTSCWNEESDANIPSDQSKSSLSIEDAKKRLYQLHQLRQDIDQLRTMLANRYADTIGDNCVTH